jgi:hypothetical protein
MPTQCMRRKKRTGCVRRRYYRRYCRNCHKNRRYCRHNDSTKGGRWSMGDIVPGGGRRRAGGPGPRAPGLLPAAQAAGLRLEGPRRRPPVMCGPGRPGPEGIAAPSSGSARCSCGISVNFPIDIDGEPHLRGISPRRCLPGVPGLPPAPALPQFLPPLVCYIVLYR